jgi:hypothetical protein
VTPKHVTPVPLAFNSYMALHRSFPNTQGNGKRARMQKNLFTPTDIKTRPRGPGLRLAAERVLAAILVLRDDGRGQPIEVIVDAGADHIAVEAR